MRNSRSQGQIWGPPTLVAITSFVGLAAALLGDGAWHLVSWIALAVPVLICL